MLVPKLKRIIRTIIFYPVLRAYCKSSNRELIDEDIVRWCNEHNIMYVSMEDALTKLMFNHTFRTVLYYRLPKLSSRIKSFYKSDSSFFISPTCEIEGGIVFLASVEHISLCPTYWEELYNPPIDYIR